MKKIKLKNILNINFLVLGIIFFNMSLNVLGADITVTFSSSVHSTGEWEGTLYAPTRIEVVRSPGKDINMILPQEYFMKGLYTGTKTPNGGTKSPFSTGAANLPPLVTLIPSGNLIRDPDDDYHEINQKKTQIKNNRAETEIKARNSGGIKSLGVKGQWRLDLPATAPDGTTTFTMNLSMQSNTFSDTCTLIVKTLPVITIGYIDFGSHPSDTQLNLHRESLIDIQGGTPNVSYNLSTAPLLELIKAGTTETIPVNMSIDFHTGKSLNASGNSSAKLIADIDSVSPSTPGVYTGTATVTFTYD